MTLLRPPPTRFPQPLSERLSGRNISRGMNNDVGVLRVDGAALKHRLEMIRCRKAPRNEKVPVQFLWNIAGDASE